MRKFIILSVALLLIGLPAMACSDHTTNYYIFNIGDHAKKYYNYTHSTTQQANSYWEAYAGRGGAKAVLTLREERESNLLWRTAVAKKDKEMQAYLKALMAYPGFTTDNTWWYYPTKEQIEQRQNALQATLKTATTYRAKRLKSQFLYLAMRAAFGLKQYDKVEQLWKQGGISPQNYCYAMAQNLYAGALLRQNKYNEAISIYGEQEDWASIRYLTCFKSYEELPNIRAQVALNPDSKALYLLLQNFVNNAESYYSNTQFRDDDETSAYAKQVEEFIALADELIVTKRVKQPALWQSAVAMLRYYQGKYHEAAQRAAAAQADAVISDAPVQTNARIIKLITSLSVAKQTPEYRDYLATELQWIDDQCDNFCEYSRSHPESYFNFMRIRLIDQDTYECFHRWGAHTLPLHLLAYVERISPSDVKGSTLLGMAINWNDQTFVPRSFGNFRACLDSLPVQEVITFAQELKVPGKDALERWIKSKGYANIDFYNDYIGTRLLAQGQFEQALPYLEQVSLEFLGLQPIARYARQRSYKTAAWVDKQWLSYNDYWSLDNDCSPLYENQKLNFCYDVLQLRRALTTARGNEQAELAYKLASYLYQASYWGQCWFLTTYYHSDCDTHLTKNSYPFVEEAIKYLTLASKSKDKNMQIATLFALAEITTNTPLEKHLNEAEEYQYGATLLEQCKPYFDQIYQLNKHKQQALPTYISNCALYRQYLKQR